MLRSLALLILIIAQPALAAPKAELWARWQAHDAASVRSVDHGVWDSFLKMYVRHSADGINRVAYGAVTQSQRAALNGYLDYLSHMPVSRLNRGEQRAVWINLYNALTVQVVLNHYPLQSIRDIDISPGLFANGPWGKKLIMVEGEALSLDDIEHRILRPIWRDARLHYALNCAALGCPNLQDTAFTAANSDTLLTTAARVFINHQRGVRMEGGKLYVASIYEWFKDDFGGNDAGVISHIKLYIAPDRVHLLDDITRITDDDYDWLLNDGP